MAIMAVSFYSAHLEAFAALERCVAVCLFASKTIDEEVKARYRDTTFVSASLSFADVMACRR
jgi:hypothetical protein